MFSSLRESNNLFKTVKRLYRAPDKHLEMIGIKNKEIIRNATVAELYEYAMMPEHKHNFNPQVRDSWLTQTGAMVAYSGKRTGRVPKEKRVVCDKITEKKIWWSDANISFTAESHEVV